MDLSNATPSRIDGPTRFAMHAVEGFGKTTIACHFPNPIIVGAENGIPRDLGFAVQTLSPRSWFDVFDIAGSLMNDRHDYGTVVLDTVDWMEPLIHRFVTERDSERQTEMNPKGRKLLSIEDYGYGKGYLVAEEEFRKLITVLDELQAKRGMHVVMLMHSQVRTFKNPAGPDFDRYEPKCQQRISRVIVEWCENLLFGYFQVLSSKEPDDVARNEKTARAKGIGTGVRVVGARQTAMYDAKNRVSLPPEFELGENIGDLIPVLLGENVAQNDRRAPLRAVVRDEGWADRQHREAGAQAQAQARDDAREMVSGGDRLSVNHQTRDTTSTRDEQNGPQTAPAKQDSQEDLKAKWEAERKAERDSKTNGKQAAQQAKPAQSVDPTLARLTKAITESGRLKGDAYRKNVEKWSTQAAGEVPKIEAIIKRVEKDLGITITA